MKGRLHFTGLTVYQSPLLLLLLYERKIIQGEVGVEVTKAVLDVHNKLTEPKLFFVNIFNM